MEDAPRLTLHYTNAVWKNEPCGAMGSDDDSVSFILRHRCVSRSVGVVDVRLPAYCPYMPAPPHAYRADVRRRVPGACAVYRWRRTNARAYCATPPCVPATPVRWCLDSTRTADYAIAYHTAALTTEPCLPNTLTMQRMDMNSFLHPYQHATLYHITTGAHIIRHVMVN